MEAIVNLFFIVFTFFLILKRKSLRFWSFFLGLWLFTNTLFLGKSFYVSGFLWVSYFVFVIILNVKKVRQGFSNILFKHAKKNMDRVNINIADDKIQRAILQDHSYFFQELYAIKENNLTEFDDIIFRRWGDFITHFLQGLLLSLSAGRLSNAPYTINKRYYQRFDQYCYAFSLLVDFAFFITLSKNKREKLLVVLSENLGLLSLGSAFLNYLQKTQWNEEQLSLVNQIFKMLLFEIQEKMLEVIFYFSKSKFHLFIKKIVFPYGARQKRPSSFSENDTAMTMLLPGKERERIISSLFLQAEENNEAVSDRYFDLLLKIETIQYRLRKALKEGKISGEEFVPRVTAGLAAEVITQEEADLLFGVKKLTQTHPL
ncbi:MAG: acyl-CoA dehydrogenase [uncultured bacterium]|nr:MAG: acyl-CoA dehydrogenase [uncultured bacterium]